MQGVSGVTGAGPLLHRAVMVTARRVPPGAFATPAEAGAVAAPVCRLSGLRATSECAQLTEWFAPGTVPTQADDWERGGRVTLPAEYAEWARDGLRPALESVTLAADGAEARGAARTNERSGPDSLAPARPPAERAPSAKRVGAARFRIVSPLDGDRYAIPAGVEARYATIPLRAGGAGAEGVRWSVDGEPHRGERWSLAPGRHVIRAVTPRGESAEARIVVQER
jgi:penicillin-binding protein 1C